MPVLDDFYYKTIWGYRWYRPELRRKGKVLKSFQLILDSLGLDEVMMITLIEKYGRKYAVVPLKDVGKLISKNRYMYEVLQHSKKRSVYFDIDGKMSSDPMPEVKELINSILPNAILAISGYRNPGVIEGGKTFSYHIKVLNYHIEPHADLSGLKAFCKKFKDVGFDPGVYSKNRMMKCINQSKKGGLPQNFIEGPNKLGDHVINSPYTNSEDFFKYFSDYNDCSKVSIPFKKFAGPHYDVHEIVKEVDNSNELNDFRAINFLVDLISRADYEHNVSNKITLFLIKKGFNAEQIWDVLKKKRGDKERRDKFMNNNYPYALEIHKSGENNVSFGSLVKEAIAVYPYINREYYTRRMIEACKFVITKNSQDIEREFLQADDYMNNFRVDYSITPMGSNKTGSVIDFDKKFPDRRSVFIGCRVSLTKNAAGRFGDDWVEYNDVKRMREIFGMKGKKTEIKKQCLPLINKLIITPNSIHHVKDVVYDNVYVDEMELFLTSWLSDETHTYSVNELKVNNYLKNFSVVVNIIKNAKKVILMDAIPSVKTLNFLKRIGVEDVNIIKSSFGYKRQKMVMHKSHIAMKERLAKDVKEGKKVYVFWPFKKDNSKYPGQTTFVKSLEKEVGRDLKYLVYNSDLNKDPKHKNTLLNVNEEWKDMDIVVVNQSITVGVNFDIPDVFDSVYLFDVSFVSVREILQTSRRIRNLVSNTIYYTELPFVKSMATEIPTIEMPDVLKYLIADIHEELSAKTKDVKKHMFKIANMECVYDKTVVEEEKKLFDEFVRDTLYDYNCIPDIDNLTYEKYCEELDNVQEYLQLQKYVFKQYFDADENVLSYLWDKKSVVEKIIEEMESPFFGEVCKELEIESIVELPEEFKLSEELLSKLKEKYHFKNLNIDKSSDMYIMRSILNTHFKTEAYTMINNERNMSYGMNNDFSILWNDVKLSLKKTEFRENLCG